MFPFRPSTAVTALLDAAEAMLAPEPTAGAPETLQQGRSGCAGTHANRPHPHRRPLVRNTSRRPGPPAAVQLCLSPVARAGAQPTHAGSTAADVAATGR
ncbi:MAG TPA: hypothetical protein VFF79_07440 [Conexibacter sp.]|nr:hypothetical protein [Conexibacter sp.]